jgi:hypothetical protein
LFLPVGRYFIFYKFLDGGVHADLIDGRLHLRPQGHEGAGPIESAVGFQDAADTGRGSAAALIQSLEDLLHRDFMGGSFEMKTAVKSSFGLYDTGMFQTVQDDFQKTQGNGLGSGNLGRFQRDLPLVFGQFVNGPQSVLFLLSNQHGLTEIIYASG